MPYSPWEPGKEVVHLSKNGVIRLTRVIAPGQDNIIPKMVYT